MKLDLNSQTLNVSFACRIEDAWVPVPETACTQSGFDWTLNGAHYSAQFTPAGDTLCYTLQMDAPNPTMAITRPHTTTLSASTERRSASEMVYFLTELMKIKELK